MSAPSVDVTKSSAAATQARQIADGILAIIAPCVGSAGLPVNVPTPFSDDSALQVAGVEGPLVEDGAYFIRTAKHPCLAIRPTTSVSGFYGGNPLICGGSAGLPVLAVPSNGPPAHLTVTGHGLRTGDVVSVAGATGDTAINTPADVVTVIDANTISLAGITGSGAYDASSATIKWLGVSFIGTGTAVPFVGSAAAIADDYTEVQVQVILGGTLGTGPITLQASLDGGLTFTAPFSLGTALTYTPPVPLTGASSGVVLDFTTAQTLVTGDLIKIYPTGPRMNSADLTAALAALGQTDFDWDLVLVHGETSGALVTVQDGWSTAEGAKGVFPFLLANTRHRNILGGETDGQFQTAMSTLLASTSTINVCVGTDAADLVSSVSGLTKAMPPSLYIATRLETKEVGVDAARVSDSSIPNAGITGTNGLPKWHDEMKQGGLDSTTIRLSTLRTFSDRQGTYITNAYVLSPTGSTIVYAQHARVMNAGCQAVFSAMTDLLSSGYYGDPKTGKIAKLAALDFQSRGQAVLDQVLAGQVSGSVFEVSQNDINLGNGPAKITCTVKNLALGYVKKFAITSEFVNTLQ